MYPPYHQKLERNTIIHEDSQNIHQGFPRAA